MAEATRRPLVAGNWKMNGLKASAVELDKIIAGGKALLGTTELMVCPPATLLLAFVGVARGSGIAIGGQDCRAEPAGAYTGDISADMLKDAGAAAVILGHSERRALHRETDVDVKAKAEAAWRAGLTAIVCIGETQAEREMGRTLDVLGRQLDGSLPEDATGANLVIAYEPVWAIGTGLTPTAADVAQAHEFIRQRLATRFGGRGRGDANSLRRLGQALERPGADGGRQRRWRAGRGRKPQSRRVPGYCRRLSQDLTPAGAAPVPGWKWSRGSCRDRREFLYRGSLPGPVGPAGV